MLLYGASGHGKVIKDIVCSNDLEVKVFFDDNEKIIFFEDIKVNTYSEFLFPDEDLIVSIGNNSLRKKITQVVKHNFGLIHHNSSIISPFTNIDLGTVVMQGAIIQSNVKIGKHVIVNTGAKVDHDCIVEDYVHVSPNVTLCGNVYVGEGTMLGASSVVIPGVKIGRWVTIGAGAVVINNIPDGATVVGNPAKNIK